MLIVALTAAPAVACVDLSGNDAAPTTWETILTPAPAYPGLGGQAAAVSRHSGTDLGIGLSGATGGDQHPWGVRQGSCAQPGQPLGGSYPILVVSDSGTASAETVLGTELSSDGSYTVVVRLSPADTARIACGNLARR
jgi:hypothetical protein